jgi:hypothetical protein
VFAIDAKTAVIGNKGEKPSMFSCRLRDFVHDAESYRGRVPHGYWVPTEALYLRYTCSPTTPGARLSFKDVKAAGTLKDHKQLTVRLLTDGTLRMVTG